MKHGVPPAVVEVVKAWAAAGDLDRAPQVLADGRRALDPLLLPALLVEIAEVQGELLIAALDLPPPASARGAAQRGAEDAPLVEVLGLQLRQDQAQRLQAWLDDQRPTAEALGLDIEAWAKKLEAGLGAVIAALRGASASASPERAAALDAAERLVAAQRATGAATTTFQGGVDPATSAQAGLRGLLAAREFKGDAKKK